MRIALAQRSKTDLNKKVSVAMKCYLFLLAIKPNLVRRSCWRSAEMLVVQGLMVMMKETVMIEASLIHLERAANHSRIGKNERGE